MNEAPENLDKHALTSMMQRAKQLQQQGAKEDSNQELAHIMNSLRSLQHSRQPLSAIPLGKTTMPLNNHNDNTNHSPSPSTFTKTQLTTLRHQILAFKLLSKNMPLPSHLQQAILSSSKPKDPPNESQGPDTLEDDTPTEERTIKKADFTAYASPYTLIPRSTHSASTSNQQSIVPSITPLGMDTYSIITERERRLQARIRYRMDELERLPGNLANHTDTQPNPFSLQSSHPHHDNNSSSSKLRAVIELKSLRLLSKQRKLREQVIHAVDRCTTLSTSADRLAYRRMKKQSLREARMTEKIERQQRLNREYREKQKHMDYLQSICDHGRTLVMGQFEHKAKQSKLGRAVLQYHVYIEKEEQKKVERISKERIQALKNDDEEAYMKLIDEAKDTRLTQLLKQTGEFLGSLTLAVVDQQNDPVHARHLEDNRDRDDVGVDIKDDYYQVTHRIKEAVTQSSLLIGGKLKEYQLKGLQWMVSLYNNHLNGILADEMGLGKTIQTLSLITYLIEHKRQMGPFLIIVPLSTLPNWVLEFEKWAPAITKIVYKGNPQSRRPLQASIRQGGFQVLLTTFDYIIKDRPVLCKVRWTYLIIDEGHRMKNANSKLTSVLRQYYTTRYRLILTGTPLQNNLPELWALLNFILPKIFKSVKSFEEWFNTPFTNQGVQDRVGLNEEEQLLIIKRLHKVLRPFLLRRLKRDVESELPDKVERVIKCKLSPLQSKVYNQMKKHGILFTGDMDKGSKKGVKGLNNTLMQLRKICNHPFVFEQVENAVNPLRRSNELLFRVSGKFELLDRMLPKLERTGHRVLIFFQMTQIMSIMEDFLSYRGFNYLRLDGSTKADDRSLMLKQFNAPDSPYSVFLLSTRAGGLGLNLQTADTVIIFDSDWNPHQDLQAQDRAHRIGQTKEVRIFRLVSANTVEENILARANYKLDIDGKVIQAGKFDNRSTEEDREAFLRSLLEEKNDEASDGEDDVVDDEELNQILLRNEGELEIFAQVDAEKAKEDMEWWQRTGGRGTKVERLIQDSELPEIYQRDDYVPVNSDDENEYGRGQRVREEIHYDYGGTDDELSDLLMTDDEQTETNQPSRKTRGRKQRSTTKPQENGTNGRLGRRKREESVDLDEARKQQKPSSGQQIKRGRHPTHNSIDGPDTVSPNVRKQMTDIFEQVYQEALNTREEEEDTYRDLSDLFMTLVSKDDYPTYYTMIKEPISMEMILERIRSPYYRTIQQFRDDFRLMYDNARTFNEEGSFVYEDANTLQDAVEAKLDELCPGGVMPPSHISRMR
ncbi:hypothetical protein [Absidia glauca]|uniref:Uncharacterized protein n=1 Tax=Absidia glauca TaxID=4829 RepID=A0A168L650_ABSGL|nr:hypothetical protein [Absidia glauca]